MSDLPQKRSADEIKSESIKRSKTNDSPEDSGRIDDGTAEVSSRSPPNEGGESVVKQPNSDLTIKPPSAMAETAPSAEKSDPVSLPESVVKQPNSDLTSKPPSAMAETAQSAEKSVCQLIIHAPSLYRDDALVCRPPTSNRFTPNIKPWRPDPDSVDKDHDNRDDCAIPDLGFLDRVDTTAYCIGCGKRTEFNHAMIHSATKIPAPKPIEGLFRSADCTHCAPVPCKGHTWEAITRR